MKTFKFISGKNNNEVELTIKDKYLDGKFGQCIVRLVVNGTRYAENGTAYICSMRDKSKCVMGVKCDVVEDKTALICICDLKKENENADSDDIIKNREVVDYIFKFIEQKPSRKSLLYRFTTKAYIADKKKKKALAKE